MFSLLKKKLASSIKALSVRIYKPSEEKGKKEKKVSLRKRLTTKISKIVSEKTITDSVFSDFFLGLEQNLLESNVALSVIESLKELLHKEIVGSSVKRSEFGSVISRSLRKAIESVLIPVDINSFLSDLKAKPKPLSILFVGTNGSGKTTTIAKVASFLKSKGFSVVLSASDTFRAASIDQLSAHADRVGVRVIKHDYGADPAAVAFDALKHAKSKNIDVVLIDTAGRSHTNKNLMDELSKIKRVVKPSFTVFVGDSLTGNDVVTQARQFNEATKLDYVILTKTDVDEKGGAIISVGFVTKVPILFLGSGQEYKDLKPFNKEELLNAIFS